MIDRKTKLRWRRRVRRSKLQAVDTAQAAEVHIERHFIYRLGRLWSVRRFIASWFAILIVLGAGVILQVQALSPLYQSVQPIPGGTYQEGIVGSFTNANPLYATGPVDSTVSQLVFSGLLRYDKNGKLTGDLAESWKTDRSGRVYTVTLRKNLVWHDGAPLTADDVLFTYDSIKNPDTRSPLNSSWNEIALTKKDDRTIIFTLPGSFIAFPHYMTNGIVPEHILSGVPANQMRSVPFNTVSPVGSGPFRWEELEVVGGTADTREERIALTAFNRYALGRPEIDRFVLRSFRDDETMVGSFQNQELDGMAGLENVPEQLNENDIYTYNYPLASATMTFFRTSHEVLRDTNVRQALVRATDKAEIIKEIGYPVKELDSALLKIHPGYSESFAQQTGNPGAAEKILDKAGWKKGEDGVRVKRNQRLAFRLFSENNAEYDAVSRKLQEQWRAIGADVEVVLQPDIDLQSTIAFHTYDALLYGIALGTEPDVFAYWHSSQADVRSPNRLNFSEYQSDVADSSLEAGRTRSNDQIQAVKYRPFVKAWQQDAPAVALYQPRYLYVAQAEVEGMRERTLTAGTERHANVHNWMIRRAPVDNPGFPQ
jgi:peptide/nickel transport system substrate-binding protein